MPRRVPSATAAFPLADAVRPVRADPDHVGDDQQRRVLQRQRLLPELGSKAASRAARRERRRLCDLLHEVPWPLTADPALEPDRGLDAGSAGQRRGLHRARGLIGRRAVFRWWSVGCGMKGPQMAKTKDDQRPWRCLSIRQPYAWAIIMGANMRKVGKDGYESMRSLLTDIVSDVVRKTLFGPA